jgi:hypothetical protein
MGQFDGPHFRVDDEDVVSIWAATCPLADIPDNYFEDYGSDEDDDPFDPFSSDFGFGCYNHDDVEAYSAKDVLAVPIGELLTPLSFSVSFRDDAVRQAEARGVGQTCYVFLLYNFKYDPAVTGIRESACMRFIGVFPYDRKA